MNLSGRIAVVGAAGTEVGVVPSMSPTELCVDAALSALRDAGLDKSAIDGIIPQLPADVLSAEVTFTHTLSFGTWGACRSGLETRTRRTSPRARSAR